ncbi:MAG: tyrosine-type recombinase/integrase, partial [Thermoleophilia bacterium]|nr:tyrosine-type recombinase/integrase [Thermoleophilia bacterium]
KSRRVVRTLDNFEGYLSDARRLAAGSDEDALVWRRLDGRPLPQQTTARRWLYPAEQEAGLPRAGWHRLRHSFAGVLRDRGVELVEARDLLGHESIKTTADVYQRLDLETQRARAEAL